MFPLKNLARKGLICFSDGRYVAVRQEHVIEVRWVCQNTCDLFQQTQKYIPVPSNL